MTDAIKTLRSELRLRTSHGRFVSYGDTTQTMALDDALDRLEALVRAAEEWAHQRRRYIDGETNQKSVVIDAEADLVHAILEVRAVKGEQA